jgi:hypothetical protein
MRSSIIRHGTALRCAAPADRRPPPPRLVVLAVIPQRTAAASRHSCLRPLPGVLADHAGLAQAPDNRCAGVIGIAERLNPSPQRRPARGTGGHHGELSGNALHGVQRLMRQHTKEVVLVGEVQIGRAVGCVRPADDVVHRHGLKAPFTECGQAGLREPAHRALAAGAHSALSARLADRCMTLVEAFATAARQPHR